MNTRSLRYRRGAGMTYYAVVGGNFYVGPFDSYNDASDRIPDADSIVPETDMRWAMSQGKTENGR